MANQIDNRLIVVGLKENPEDFARDLEREMYGQVVPHESGNFFVEVVNGNFDFTTKWAPKVDAVIEVSKKRKDHVFLLSYGGFETQRNGQVVIRGGDVLESFDRIGYFGLFDELEHPTLDLFFPHLRKRTLAECAANRLQDAIGIVRGLVRILDDHRLKHSASKPYSDVRDRGRTERVRADLAALVDSMDMQIRNLNFRGVLLEESELQEGLVRHAKLAGELMRTLDLDCLAPDPNAAARFAILPFTAASTQDPCLVILPILHYLNADRLSGKYAKDATGSYPPIEWQVRYLCLSPWEVRQIGMLPDDDQTPPQIDIIMTYSVDRGLGRELHRASNKARWMANPGLVKEVEKKAIELSHTLANKLAGPGVRIFNHLEALEAALFAGKNQ